jgi:hypothetical protein
MTICTSSSRRQCLYKSEYHPGPRGTPEVYTAHVPFLKNKQEYPLTIRHANTMSTNHGKRWGSIGHSFLKNIHQTIASNQLKDGTASSTNHKQANTMEGILCTIQ